MHSNFSLIHRGARAVTAATSITRFFKNLNATPFSQWKRGNFPPETRNSHRSRPDSFFIFFASSTTRARGSEKMNNELVAFAKTSPA
jgi:hypothetical protein